MATLFKLEKGEELRFETEGNETGLLQLVEMPSCCAEIFGTELAPNRVYSFPPGSKVGVFTWHGCHVKLEGCTQIYSQKWEQESPMHTYASAHMSLHEMREQAKLCQQRGPRVLVCGPPDSGKNTICRIFLNYATRQGYTLTYCDLDPAWNEIGIPGSVGAVSLDTPVNIDDGFNSLSPLLYHLGDLDATRNSDLFNKVVEELARGVRERMLLPGNEPALAGGLIVNTPGVVNQAGYDMLVNAIQSFDINVVFVLGEDRLSAKLRERFRPMQDGANTLLNAHNTPLVIHKLPKSGGVVIRDSVCRQREIQGRIREYFYGSPRQGGRVFHPHRMVLNFGDLSLYKFGGEKASSNLLPIGEKSLMDLSIPHLVQPYAELLHCIGSVSFATDVDELPKSNIAGYVHFQQVNMEEQKFTLLVPSPGSLPSRFILIGETQWLEQL